VDNASTDGSAKAVLAGFPWVTLVQNEANEGYAKGNNQGFAAAKGDWVLTLNPDTEIGPGLLDSMLKSAKERDSYGVFAVRLVGPDQKSQRSVRGFPTLLGVFGALTGLDKRFPEGPLGAYTLPNFDYGASGPAPQPMGTFLLFRRSALETVGDPSSPFDEQFPIFFNEVDLLYRLHRAGWPCWYESSLSILHQHGASTRQRPVAMVWESHRSLVRYFRKHLRGPARLALPIVAAAAYVGAFVRANAKHARS
jgi:GT2 family glycosyltransferase